MIVVVAYDIAVHDGRREDVASPLSGYGPRVQLSVFESQVRTRPSCRRCGRTCGC